MSASWPQRLRQDLQHPHDDRHHRAGLRHRQTLRPAISTRDSQRVGYLPEERGLTKKMKVGPAHLPRRTARPRRHHRQQACPRLVRAHGDHRSHRKTEELSKGCRRSSSSRAAARARPHHHGRTLQRPRSRQRRLLWTLRRSRAQGKTILFSTHRMDQVEKPATPSPSSPAVISFFRRHARGQEPLPRNHVQVSSKETTSSSSIPPSKPRRTMADRPT